MSLRISEVAAAGAPYSPLPNAQSISAVVASGALPPPAAASSGPARGPVLASPNLPVTSLPLHVLLWRVLSQGARLSAGQRNWQTKRKIALEGRLLHNQLASRRGHLAYQRWQNRGEMWSAGWPFALQVAGLGAVVAPSLLGLSNLSNNLVLQNFLLQVFPTFGGMIDRYLPTRLPGLGQGEVAGVAVYGGAPASDWVAFGLGGVNRLRVEDAALRAEDESLKQLTGHLQEDVDVLREDRRKSMELLELWMQDRRSFASSALRV